MGFISVEVKKSCYQHRNVLVSLVFENKHLGRQLSFDVLHGDRHNLKNNLDLPTTLEAASILYNVILHSYEFTLEKVCGLGYCTETFSMAHDSEISKDLNDLHKLW